MIVGNTVCIPFDLQASDQVIFQLSVYMVYHVPEIRCDGIGNCAPGP